MWAGEAADSCNISGCKAGKVMEVVFHSSTTLSIVLQYWAVCDTHCYYPPHPTWKEDYFTSRESTLMLTQTLTHRWIFQHNLQIKNTAAPWLTYIMHPCMLGCDWLHPHSLSLSVCGNSLPIHPATPYSSCHGDSLPPRAFSAASSVVTMATTAWPWACCFCRCCRSYYSLDLDSSLHPRQAHMTWVTDLLLFVVGCGCHCQQRATVHGPVNPDGTVLCRSYSPYADRFAVHQSGLVKAMVIDDKISGV